jgi:peptidyl-prolyl cis-trans isomerase C
MKTKSIYISLIVLLLLLIVAGCGKKGDKAIATIGDYTITADELNQSFERFRQTFSTSQGEYDKRSEIIDSLIITRLLIQAAYEKNIDKLPEIEQIVSVNRDKFLLDALYQKHIASKIEPTDAELKNFYDKQEFKIRASHILLNNADSAQLVYEKIQNGEDFEELATTYSVDPSVKRNKGDLGYFTWGAMVEEFQQAAFAMEPGEISQPIKSQFGFHIINLKEKVVNVERDTFEKTKNTIMSQLRTRKTFRVTTDYFQDIKKRHKVEINKETCDYLMEKRESIYPPQLLNSMPKNDFDSEQLDQSEKDMILATYEDKQMTISDYLAQIKNIPAHFRPDLSDYDSLAAVVFELKKLEILIIEAQTEKLDQEEDYLEKIKLFKELNMADIMKNDSIPTPVPPDEALLRTYYDNNTVEFTTPAKIQLFEIYLSDELKANKLASEIKTLDAFKENATRLTERPGLQNRDGDMGYIERDWFPEVYDAAKDLPIGTIAGPIFNNGKYSIIYVVEKQESVLKDFLSVKQKIFEDLQKEQKYQTLKKWVDLQKDKTEVTIDDIALRETIDMSKYPLETGSEE